MMDVIPAIMSEKVAEILPVSILKRIALCSSAPILDRVRNYLSSTEADEKVKLKVSRCYEDRFSAEDINVDEDLIARAEELEELNPATLCFEADMEYLERIAESIDTIVNSDDIVDYIAPVKGVLIKSIIDDLKELAKNSTNAKELSELAKRLKSASALFKDAANQGYKRTPYSKILYKETYYRILLMGIQNIIKNKNAGANPNTWRYL